MSKFPYFFNPVKSGLFFSRIKVKCKSCELKENCICSFCGDNDCKAQYPCSQVEEITRCKKRP